MTSKFDAFLLRKHFCLPWTLQKNTGSQSKSLKVNRVPFTRMKKFLSLADAERSVKNHDSKPSSVRGLAAQAGQSLNVVSLPSLQSPPCSTKRDDLPTLNQVEWQPPKVFHG